MKRLSEVCKITGISRSSLQRYHVEGLLSPTNITSGGYWEYDDNAIKVLILIQMLRDAGYKRKEIKNFFETNDISFEELCDNAISSLKEKQKHIKGMIKTLEEMKVLVSLPRPVIKAFSKTNLNEVFKEENFKDMFNRQIDEFSDSVDAELSDEDKALKFFLYNIYAIGFLKDQPVESKDVMQCYDLAIKEFWKLAEVDFEDLELKAELDQYTDEEFSNDMREQLEEMFKDPDWIEMIDETCGLGATEFIRKVIKKYRIKKPLIKGGK